MATRSTIAYKDEEGKIHSIYCHWDGYGHLPLLVEHYNTIDKVKELITLGSLSVLRKKITPTTSTHSFDDPEEDVCIAYCRDRGEELAIDEYYTIKQWMRNAQEYNYLFDNGVWTVRFGDNI